MAGGEAGPRFGIASGEAPGGTRIGDLPLGDDGGFDLVEVAHQLRMEVRGEGRRRAPGGTGLQRPAFGAPSGTAAIENADLRRAHGEELPPDAGRGKQARL